MSADTRSTPASTPLKRRTNSDLFLTWLILLLAPIGQMAIDIYTPSLPVMVDYFGSSQSMVQLSVSLYLVAFAIGQLFYGPLSDAFGRKSSLLGGIVLFGIGSVACILSPTIETFIAARLVQGVGITTASVVMKAIATDRFEGKKLQHVMTYMVISWGLGPIIAPVIGAQLQVHFSWRYSLYFLLAYGAVLLFLVGVVYIETNSRPVRTSLRTTLANARMIMADGRFTFTYLSMGLYYALLLTFNLVGPFLVQDVMDFSPTVYSAIALLIGAAYLVGVLTNRILPGGVTQRSKFLFSSNVALVMAIVQTVLSLALEPNIWVLVAPTVVMVYCAGVLYPNLMTLGVSRFPQYAGLASSLLGFCLMLCSGLIMVGSSYLQATTIAPLAATLFACLLGGRLMVMRTLPKDA